MKRKQDIEKIFQDRQHQLEEVPSSRAWKRLESRLDGNRSIRRRSRPAFRIMGMAATLLFLVATIALMTTLFRTQNKQTASAEAILGPPVMEELKTPDDQKGVYAIAVSFQRYLNQSPSVFAEGAQDKKLIPPSKFNSSPPEDKGFLAKAEVAKAKEEEARAGRANEDSRQQSSPRPSPEAEAASGAGSTSNTASAYDGNQLVVPEETRRANSLPPPTAYDAPPAANLPIARSEAKEKESAESAKVDSYTRARQADRIDPTLNAITYDADPAIRGVEQFQWLIGQWQAPLGKNRKTIEQWKQKDQFTIEGSGQLVVNGDTTFTEGMKIQKIGENLYYILALDENHQEVRFQLRSLQADVAVFETEAQGVPQQLIIQQHNLNNFSTTLQNAASSEIEETQRAYLQNRNYIEQNQRTVRNMSRVNKD